MYYFTNYFITRTSVELIDAPQIGYNVATMTKLYHRKSLLLNVTLTFGSNSRSWHIFSM